MMEENKETGETEVMEMKEEVVEMEETEEMEMEEMEMEEDKKMEEEKCWRAKTEEAAEMPTHSRSAALVAFTALVRPRRTSHHPSPCGALPSDGSTRARTGEAVSPSRRTGQ